MSLTSPTRLYKFLQHNPNEKAFRQIVQLPQVWILLGCFQCLCILPLNLQKICKINSNSIKIIKDTRLEDWLAVVTIEIFDNLCTIYSSLSNCCTDEICSVMSIGSLYEYSWHDFHENKNVNCTAPRYIHLFFTFVQKAIANPSIFPTQPNKSYPDNFRLIILYICKVI